VPKVLLLVRPPELLESNPGSAILASLEECGAVVELIGSTSGKLRTVVASRIVESPLVPDCLSP
jgi:hypothetical protein